MPVTACFVAGIQRPTGIAVEPEDRGRVHDGPAARPEHLLDLVLHAVEDALDVHIKQERCLFDVLLVEGHLLAVRPALLKARSSRPNSLTARCTRAFASSGLLTSVHLKDGTTSGLLDGPHDFFAELGSAVADDKRSTGPGHRQAVALPMPVPPPVTMPTLLAKGAMSAPPRGRRRVVIRGADGQRRVGAVQIFHRGEDQVGVTNVLDVVEQILAGAEWKCLV